MDEQNDAKLKAAVRTHWSEETCGTRYGVRLSRKSFFDDIEQARYAGQPFIHELADFDKADGKDVLEVGVGAGTDTLQWLRAGATLSGIDLTREAIDLTRERLQLEAMDPSRYSLFVGDAENLTFEDNSFDIVYSYGVFHHSPDTGRCIKEAFRVLRPGGSLRIMVYNINSVTCTMLWLLYLVKGDFQSRRSIVYDHMESPGTKAYTKQECIELVRRAGFQNIEVRTRTGPSDLLTITPRQKYQHRVYHFLWRLYPRFVVRLLGDRFGHMLLVRADKQAAT